MPICQPYHGFQQRYHRKRNNKQKSSYKQQRKWTLWIELSYHHQSKPSRHSSIMYRKDQPMIYQPIFLTKWRSILYIKVSIRNRIKKILAKISHMHDTPRDLGFVSTNRGLPFTICPHHFCKIQTFDHITQCPKIYII